MGTRGVRDLEGLSFAELEAEEEREAVYLAKKRKKSSVLKPAALESQPAAAAPHVVQSKRRPNQSSNPARKTPQSNPDATSKPAYVCTVRGCQLAKQMKSWSRLGDYKNHLLLCHPGAAVTTAVKVADRADKEAPAQKRKLNGTCSPHKVTQKKAKATAKQSAVFNVPETPDLSPRRADNSPDVFAPGNPEPHQQEDESFEQWLQRVRPWRKVPPVPPEMPKKKPLHKARSPSPSSSSSSSSTSDEEEAPKDKSNQLPNNQFPNNQLPNRRTQNDGKTISKSELAEQLKSRRASSAPVDIPQVPRQPQQQQQPQQRRQPQQQIPRVAQQQQVKQCRVAGCSPCRAGATHYCKHCQTTSSTHTASDRASKNMSKAAQPTNVPVKTAASHRVQTKEPRVAQCQKTGDQNHKQPQVKVKKEATGERPGHKKPVKQKAPQRPNKSSEMQPCITVALEVLFAMLKEEFLTRQEFDQAKHRIFSSPGMTTDVVTDCVKLVKMKQAGVLTADEFSIAKQSSLNYQ